MKFTLDITTDLLAALQLMAREHECSDQKELERCVKFGIENLLYRMNRNKKQTVQKREDKRRFDLMAAKLAEQGIDIDEL